MTCGKPTPIQRGVLLKGPPRPTAPRRKSPPTTLSTALTPYKSRRWRRHACSVQSALRTPASASAYGCEWVVVGISMRAIRSDEAPREPLRRLIANRSPQLGASCAVPRAPVAMSTTKLASARRHTGPGLNCAAGFRERERA